MLLRRRRRLQFGQLPVDGIVAERLTSSAFQKRDGLPWKEWAGRTPDHERRQRELRAAAAVIVDRALAA